MSTLQRLSEQEQDRLAQHVALKIKRDFESHQGPKRRLVSGREQPVMIGIKVPELSGKSVHELPPGGIYDPGSFYNRVWFARTSHRPILMSHYFEFAFSGGRYTGTINVRYAM